MASNFIAGQDVHFDYVSGAQAETNSSKGHGKKNKRGKNVKMQAKLNRPGDDYPTSRVIRQDANGNVIVSELPDETDEKNAEKPRHMHCCRCGRCLTDSEYEEEEGQGHHEHVSSEKIAECDYEYEDGEESEYGDEYDDKEHCRGQTAVKTTLTVISTVVVRAIVAITDIVTIMSQITTTSMQPMDKTTVWKMAIWRTSTRLGAAMKVSMMMKMKKKRRMTTTWD